MIIDIENEFSDEKCGTLKKIILYNSVYVIKDKEYFSTV
jgi:hypothetical protein